MSQTAAAVQAQLSTQVMGAKIIRSEIIGTKQIWYVVGGTDVPGRTRWVETTASDTAATQAAAILTGLRAT